MNKMRLLIINDFPLVGGAEHVILALCRTIRQQPETDEWKLHLVTSKPGILVDTAAKISCCRVHIVDIYGLKKQWLNPFARQKVMKSLDVISKGVQPDVVLCNSSWSAAVVNRFFYKRGIPVICAIHADISPEMPIKRMVFSVIGKKLMRHVTRWITVSESLASQIESLKVSRHDIQVIPNGVTIPESSTIVRNGPWREKLTISSEAVVILTAGRLDPGKGQHTVIEAVIPLIKEGLDIHLLISGEEMIAKATANEKQNSYTHKLQEMIAGFGVENRISLIGYVDNIADVIRESDIVVSASRAESFGLSVLEGMAAGRTVISSDIDAHRNIVEHGVNGLLFDLKNIDAFTAVLRKAVGDKTLREQLGSAARKHARGYDSEKTYRQWVECIKRTVTEHRSTHLFNPKGVGR